MALNAPPKTLDAVFFLKHARGSRKSAIGFYRHAGYRGIADTSTAARVATRKTIPARYTAIFRSFPITNPDKPRKTAIRKEPFRTSADMIDPVLLKVAKHPAALSNRLLAAFGITPFKIACLSVPIKLGVPTRNSTDHRSRLRHVSRFHGCRGAPAATFGWASLAACLDVMKVL